MTSYTTQQGDMWDSISYKLYGDVKFTDVLINANPEFRYVYIFSEGVVLSVPDVEERITADDLPPWKRANG
jgi:phage tail protein X|nr:MAG TPA: tail protein [Caudoviricetes sp.]